MRADELLEAGAMEDRAVWIRIMKAVQELQSKERPEGVDYQRLHQRRDRR